MNVAIAAHADSSIDIRIRYLVFDRYFRASSTGWNEG